MEAGLTGHVWTLEELVNWWETKALLNAYIIWQPIAFEVVVMVGWVNPRRTATPLTGYRKPAVNASELGAILNNKGSITAPFSRSFSILGAYRCPA